MASPQVIDRKKIEKTLCTHCGEQCPDQHIHIDHDYFCCIGCKNVFDILQGQGLDHYYDLNDKPGIKFDSIAFDFLENEDIVLELLDFAQEDYHKITLDLPQIHCSSCIWLLEKLPELLEPVYESRVHFGKRKLTVLYDPRKISLKEIVQFLQKIGYPPNITLASVNKQKKDTRDVNLVIKIAVSGFFFGNSMLMSLPEYLDSSFKFEEDFVTAFGYLNLLFALPVIFYSAAHYYIQGFRGLKYKYFGINIPIAIGISIIFLRSIYEILTQSGPGYIDSLCGLVFFLLIGQWIQNRTFSSLNFDQEINSVFPLTSKVLGQTSGGFSDGLSDEQLKKSKARYTNIKTSEIKINQILLCVPKDMVTVDCELIAGEGSIDYSFITGESRPVQVKVGEKLYAGGRVLKGQLQMRSLADFDKSYLSGLWTQSGTDHSDEGNSNHHSTYKNTNHLIDQLAKYFSPTVFLIACTAFTYWAFIDSSRMWQVLTSVLIIACPCALALASPFTYNFASKYLAQLGYFVKAPYILERIFGIKHLVFDKTGTLTVPNKQSILFRVLSQGRFSEGGSIEQLAKDETSILSREASAILGLVHQSNHPLSLVIAQSLEDHFFSSTNSHSKIKPHQETNDELKYTGFEEVTGEGIKCYINRQEYRMGNAAFVGLNEEVKITYDSLGLSFDMGAISTVYWSIEGRVMGRFDIMQEYRKGIFDVLLELKKHYKLSLLSGDHDQQKTYL